MQRKINNNNNLTLNAGTNALLGNGAIVFNGQLTTKNLNATGTALTVNNAVNGQKLTFGAGSDFVSARTQVDQDNVTGRVDHTFNDKDSTFVRYSYWNQPRLEPYSRSSTTIAFRVGQSGFVELSVFDVKGSRVRTISSGPRDAGTYEEKWDGRTDRFSDAPAGIYFLVLNSAEGVKSQRVALSR